ncbi:hypothetical protein HYO12_22335 [Vibrio parahaemolyticus]|uniref:hypothetical protein n=1 Tax=Vibrio parahaemolyticus TaxID=670 RepID=UPI0004A2F8E6|nr:hypothetical protein [Vibrio parahaemolyticus]EJG1645715.1 hypothetical protein [Vibrio parahaemolyticus]MBC8659655.1 hypothetical protein [Vibrio parahaemolyticus]MBM5027737.1 hypothetical protein [Vibrio parahaemolyticus]TNZ03659.1 hypothetical protein CGK55_23775 [Vibrio parahaemolyticus]HCG8201865.1 hypothetical protein [Vibrio parahaemolyticus]
MNSYSVTISEIQHDQRKLESKNQSVEHPTTQVNLQQNPAEDSNKDTFVHDAKILFDALRNMGLCMLFVFSALYGEFYKFEALKGFESHIIYAYGTIGFYLMLINLIWAFMAAKKSGKHIILKIFTISGLALILSLQAFGLFTLKDVVFSELQKVQVESK